MHVLIVVLNVFLLNICRAKIRNKMGVVELIFGKRLQMYY